MRAERDNKLKKISRLAQLIAFQELRINISNFTLTKVTIEYNDLKCLSTLKMGNYKYKILFRWGLPYIHHLSHYYTIKYAILRSLYHPQWWLKEGPI